MRLAVWLAAAAAVAAPGAKAPPPPKPVKLVLKAGQALAFPAEIKDGKVVLGPARLGAFGRLEAAPGEISVGLSPRDKDLYDHLEIVEKTTAPIDFVATGHVGEIVIDEREIAGRIDAPISQRIGGTSWTVELREFAPSAPAK